MLHYIRMLLLGSTKAVPSAPASLPTQVLIVLDLTVLLQPPPPPGPVPCPLRTVPCSTVPSHVSKVAAVSVVKPGGKAVQLAVCITQIVATQQPASDVPPDVWRTLARPALAAEGDSVAAWLRLSMVSRTWREALAGVGSPCTDCCADAQLRT